MERWTDRPRTGKETETDRQTDTYIDSEKETDG